MDNEIIKSRIEAVGFHPTEALMGKVFALALAKVSDGTIRVAWRALEKERKEHEKAEKAEKARKAAEKLAA